VQSFSRNCDELVANTATRRCSFHSALAAEAGLHPTDYKALTVLDRLRPMSAGELSVPGLAASTVTNLIERLVAKGLLRREPDPLDRRRALLRADLAKLIGHDVFAFMATDGHPVVGALLRHRAAVILDFLADTAQRLRTTPRHWPPAECAARQATMATMTDVHPFASTFPTTFSDESAPATGATRWRRAETVAATRGERSDGR